MPRKLLPASHRLVADAPNLRQQFGALATLADVATLLQTTPTALGFLLYARPIQYVTFQIPKRHGGTREIAAPPRGIKFYQKRLAQVLNAVYKVRKPVHGFALDRNIKSNALQHVARRWVLTVDLKNFFPSIHFGRVAGVFKSYGVGTEAAIALARLCCFNGSLPQGAPTSPIVSNMICSSLDRELAQFARVHQATYTRYADDLSFSSDGDTMADALVKVSVSNGAQIVTCGPQLIELLARHSFTVNDSKVRLRSSANRQEVTGLTVNTRPNVERRFVRQVRAMLHAWRRHGYDAAEAEYLARYNRKHRLNPDVRFWAVLGGKLEFIRMVRGPEDVVYRSLRNQLADLDPVRYTALVCRARPEELERALWVVHTDSRRGTAFDLEGVGIVTAAHCASGTEGCIYRRTDPSKRYPLEIVRYSSVHDADLAVLRVPDDAGGRWSLRRAPARAEVGDDVQMVGYPGSIDALTWHKGQVASRQLRHGIANVFPSFLVHGGASGSPLLNKRLEVVGVAVWGVLRATAPGQTGLEEQSPPSSAIDIAELARADLYTGTAFPMLSF